MQKPDPAYIGWAFLSATGYGLIATVIKRHETVFLLPIYATLFIGYVFILNKANKVEGKHIDVILASSFLFRLLFFFALPSLSDDFYRFIWDGRLWSQGYHPFAGLPGEYLKMGIDGVDQQLYDSLNSKEYFTIYPPVSQAVFWLSVKIAPHSVMGSVLVMRTILFLSEIGNVFLMKRLLQTLKLPTWYILIYAINPLVIIELTGNLHFESLMIFFLLLSVYAITLNRWILSSAAMVLSIGSKLLPFLFFPVIARTLGWKKFIAYGLVAFIFLLICFYPMFDSKVIESMSNSLGLYFSKFEFNASVYYLVREIGYLWYGYNIIQTVGWKLAIVATILILVFVFRKGVTQEVSTQSTELLLHDSMFVLTIYFLFTTTLHPWYITTLLALSVFTTYRFPLIWSGLIFLSYSGYTETSFNENLWFTALEYLVVFGYMLYEIKFGKKFKQLLKR